MTIVDIPHDLEATAVPLIPASDGLNVERCYTEGFKKVSERGENAPLLDRHAGCCQRFQEHDSARN